MFLLGSLHRIAFPNPTRSNHQIENKRHPSCIIDMNDVHAAIVRKTEECADKSHHTYRYVSTHKKTISELVFWGEGRKEKGIKCETLKDPEEY
jgi:hypothetical protein